MVKIVVHFSPLPDRVGGDSHHLLGKTVLSLGVQWQVAPCHVYAGPDQQLQDVISV